MPHPRGRQLHASLVDRLSCLRAVYSESSPGEKFIDPVLVCETSATVGKLGNTNQRGIVGGVLRVSVRGSVFLVNSAMHTVRISNTIASKENDIHC